MPEVHVGAADGAGGHPYNQRAGLGCGGDRNRLHRHGLAKPAYHDCAGMLGQGGQAGQNITASAPAAMTPMGTALKAGRVSIRSDSRANPSSERHAISAGARTDRPRPRRSPGRPRQAHHRGSRPGDSTPEAPTEACRAASPSTPCCAAARPGGPPHGPAPPASKTPSARALGGAVLQPDHAIRRQQTRPRRKGMRVGELDNPRESKMAWPSAITPGTSRAGSNCTTAGLASRAWALSKV